MPARSAPREAVLLTHPVFETPAFGRNHPLSIARHGTVLALAEALGWRDAARMARCELPTVDTLARFHDRAYLAALETAALTGRASSEVRTRYNLGTMECPLFPGLWERACATVGGAILAAELALAGRLPFHPAGGTHHGRRDRASGFCYLNDPVFAITRLLDAGLARVLYVDLDAHHGDGIEAAFEADPRVMTISIHEAGRWPGSGGLGERSAIGQARNMPVPRGFNDSELRHLLHEAVQPLTARFAPDAIVITCGADALAGDPLSGLMLSNVALCDAVMALVAAVPRAVVLGGGGYNPWTLARAWTGLWGRLAGYDVSIPLPPAVRAVLAGLDCDLVDAEDRDPAWLETLWDTPRDGPVRDEIRAIAAAVMA
jgi:acetoin utilization protein AcuC